MDRRLKLTAKQKELVKELENAFAALGKENVGIVFDMNFGDFLVYNEAEVFSTDTSCEYNQYEGEYHEESLGYYDEETGEGHVWYSPKRDDLQMLSIPIVLTGYDAEWFAVKLKENEDSEAFFRGKRIEKLKDDLKKEKKKLKRRLDAIAQAESNIAIFKEKGLAQDLIDEENASILSNQEAADNIQQVIEELESEIEKLKKQK